MTETWGDYFVAQAGAAAALAGLLFVAVSINLERVLAFPNLPGRAAETLILLLGLLVAAMLALVPGQAATTLGYEITTVGMIATALISGIQLRAPRSEYENMPVRVLVSQMPAAVWVTAGICLISSSGYGMQVNVIATVLGFCSVAHSSWILLIEIQR